MDGDDEVLPPLPRMPLSSPKRLRRRAPIENQAVVSSAIVPSPRPAEIISTLIDSLTAISESARQQLREEFDQDLKQDSAVDFERPYTPQYLNPFELDDGLRQHNSGDEDEDEDEDEDVHEHENDSNGEVAAAPVVRFARSPPHPPQLSRMKKARNENRSVYVKPVLSAPGPAPRRSNQSLGSLDQPTVMGKPSIERPNGSNTSLTISIVSGRSRSPRHAPTPEPPAGQSASRPVPSGRDPSEARMVDPTTTQRGLQNAEENHHSDAFPEASPDADRSPGADALEDNSSAEGPTFTVLSPLNRGNLRESLIPFRKSSIRRSKRDSLDETQRHPTGSQDLTEMNIDSELIASDDSTVRRIRELREAREKRNNEWRKEAKTEKSPKRHSPSAKAIPRSTSYQSSKLAVTEVLIESEEQEEAPEMSACITATDLASMPALVPTSPASDSPSTPLPSPSDPYRRSAVPPVVDPRPKPSPQHSARTSYHIKRTSLTYSLRPESRANDVKSIGDEVEAFLTAPRLTQKLRHPRTGRTIAFSEVGDPDGFVVFCMVGMGLTRYVTSFYDELARTLKLRLITPDRPGVGESEAVPERLGNPLTWVDDVAVICDSLGVTRFSLLAHSAGTIYALATALKMPQFVRGRIHLLAPWIPPSQMPKGAAIGPDSQPIANLPMSHRILSVLPAPFLKVANSRFLSAGSAAGDPRLRRSKKPWNLEDLDGAFSQSFDDLSEQSLSGMMNDYGNERQDENTAARSLGVSCYQANNHSLASHGILNVSPSPEPRSSSATSRHQAVSPGPASPRLSPEARLAMYNSELTHRIWALSTLNANPAVDLMVCLERRKTIGFRYAEVTRSVVIRHGAKDTRVPLDNVRWLQTIMKRCELRILDEEGHGLMASAAVMSSVLTEIGKEWEEWQKIARDKEKKKREVSSAMSTRTASTARSKGRESRQG